MSNDRWGHASRYATVLLVLILLASLVSWSSQVNAQPMCPFDSIWDEDVEDCVPLDPTETPTSTPTEPADVPIATESPENTPAEDETVVETPTEEGVPEDSPAEETPETVPGTPEQEESDDSGTQFSVFGWDPFGFEGFNPPLRMVLYSCGRPVNAGDTYASLMPDCFSFDETSSALGFNIYTNGQYRETVGAGGSLYMEAALPTGDVGIQAFYPDDFQAAWVDCHVFYMNDDDDPVVTYRYPWLAQGRAMVTLPIEVSDSRVVCVWFFPPNDVMAVDAYAYTCPGYVTDRTIQYRDLLASCPGSSETEVQIVSNAGVQNRIADMGWAPFRNVPLDSVQIRGFPPEGYGDPLVYCMVTGPGGQTTKGLDLEFVGDQGYVTIGDVPPGGIVRCDLFFRET